MTITRRPADGFDGVTYTCRGCREGRAAETFTFDSYRNGTQPTDLDLCATCVSELTALLCPKVDVGRTGGGKVGNRHPEPSHRAASTVRAGTQQAALLRLVEISGPRGTTNAEAAGPLSIEVGHTVSRNQTATRMLELRERGLVRPAMAAGTSSHPGDVPVRRRTEGDNEGQVWVVTTAGRAELQRLTSRR